jgi:hypothetical protein
MKQRRKMVDGFFRAKRSYSASVVRQSGEDAQVNLAIATMPSGRSGNGMEAKVTTSCN